MEAKDTLYEWTTTEYIEKKKSVDWFWAVGIISVAAVVASIIYRNFLFAMFVIIGALLLVMFEVKKPKQVYMSITTRGVGIDNYLYAYKTLKSFWLDTEHHRLYLHSDRPILPMIILPAGDADYRRVRELLSKYIQEEEVHPNSLTVMVDRLGL
jgi:hypothetical protein